MCYEYSCLKTPAAKAAYFTKHRVLSCIHVKNWDEHHYHVYPIHFVRAEQQRKPTTLVEQRQGEGDDATVRGPVAEEWGQAERDRVAWEQAAEEAKTPAERAEEARKKQQQKDADQQPAETLQEEKRKAADKEKTKRKAKERDAAEQKKKQERTLYKAFVGLRNLSKETLNFSGNETVPKNTPTQVAQSAVRSRLGRAESQVAATLFRSPDVLSVLVSSSQAPPTCTTPRGISTHGALQLRDIDTRMLAIVHGVKISIGHGANTDEVCPDTDDRVLGRVQLSCGSSRAGTCDPNSFGSNVEMFSQEDLSIAVCKGKRVPRAYKLYPGDEWKKHFCPGHKILFRARRINLTVFRHRTLVEWSVVTPVP
ncbi:hypothetical protein C8R45DRAFT_932000 [Mycena sanguinolenta]|nr:hypothetical protein C8R45DRAFT_932000 [Mycena sanguinolenta]